jgi:outer membrane protein insertion porin family
MRSRLSGAALAVLVLAAAAGSEVRGAPGTVEKIIIQGLVRMSPEAFRHALEVREGDPYDAARLRDAFRRLWDLRLFKDLTIEAEDGPEGGKVVVLKVVERPVLSSVTYEENKVLTRTQIEDHLKEKKIALDVGKPLDTKAVIDAEVSIRDFLGEKGYLDAAVKHEVREVTQTSYAVSYTIRPGGKTRIKQIAFDGNRVFSDRKLKSLLQLTREQKWYWPWSSKNLYHPVKWDQDVGAIRDAYQNLGFLDVEIRAPVVDMEVVTRGGEKAPEPSPQAVPVAPAPEEPIEGLSPEEIEKLQKKQEKARKKAEKERQKQEPKVKRYAVLTVPVSEGEQYRAGTITVSGNTVLTEQEIRSLIPLREGGILGAGLLKAGIDAVTLAYGNRGYLYANVVRQIRRREGEKVGDVQIAIEEDKPYYVGQIEFSGNTTTQDKVLRREVRINEGELFNRSLLDVSKTKLNQLGYFEVQGEPAVEPVEGENRVRITFAGEEKGRNEIQVGGGYSGLDGAFFTGYYSTRNFLGKGEVVSLSAQVGGRSDYYTLQFLEPWFLNRPYSLGFNLYRSGVDYGGSLRSSGRGAGIRFGRLFGYFMYGELSFDWENVETTGFSLNGEKAENRISSITPRFRYDRVNNPYRPSRGWSTEIRAQLAGGFLGGDTAFFRPVGRYSAYRRAKGRSFLGFHAQLGTILPFQEASVSNSATVNGVPRSQRFWLGGDTFGPRVFETRSITPLRYVSLDEFGRLVDAVKDPSGQPASKYDRNGDGLVDQRDLVEMGGDRFYLLQSEFVYPFNQTVELAAFLDVGNALFEDTAWGFTDVRTSVGIELRFYLPVFPVPLRLIYGTPIRQLAQDRSNSFTFSIGRSF